MGDNLELAIEDLYRERDPSLFDRYAGGPYMGVVKETNDPLRMHRVRVLVPDLYNSNTKTEEILWAVVSPNLGGSGCGEWNHPCIGDLVYVKFEKGHAYKAIVDGFADPTRRRFYVHQSLYGPPPQTSFDLVNNQDEQQTSDPLAERLADYFPKDERPMSQGFRDRYGNTMIANAVGFFPIEHKLPPASGGLDGVSLADFQISTSEPEVNDPDTKYVASLTKYGHLSISSDVGYRWDNEFMGDFVQDEDFERERSVYYARLLNEDQPSGDDQRRLMWWTRAGHKLELRDVGFNMSREDEFDPERKILSETDKIQLWTKLRTKGGNLFQMIDSGVDAAEDKFYKRNLLEEIADLTEKESEYSSMDQRQIRFATRYGFRMALDDRGSDPLDADSLEDPRGNGFIVKGRRLGRGFTIEFNEKDEMNRYMVSSPKGKGMEVNDRFDYLAFHTDVVNPLSEEVEFGLQDDGTDDKLLDNHFATQVAVGETFEAGTFHLKLDLANCYGRFKTAEGQGWEARDTQAITGAFVQMVDNQTRNIWLSPNDNHAVWVDSSGQKYIAIDDDSDVVIIRNNADSGRVQIVARDIDLIATRDISMVAGRRISMKAGTEVCADGGGGQYTLTSGSFGTNVTNNAPQHTGFLPGAFPGPGAQGDTSQGCQPNVPQALSVSPLKPETPIPEPPEAVPVSVRRGE